MIHKMKIGASLMIMLPAFLLSNACLVEASTDLSAIPVSAAEGEAVAKPVLGAADIICQKDYQCMAIDLGCCGGEEVVAINRANVFTVKNLVRKYCRPLVSANHDLCKGKKYPMFPPKTHCIAQKCALKK